MRSASSEVVMRLTEFWTRMDSALGSAYARSWAHQHVLSGLGERTVEEALADGWDAKAVWREVWKALELPARDR
jgi:hypothetical protein